MINFATSIFFGFCLMLAYVVASFLLWKNAKKEDLSTETIFDWSLLMTGAAIFIGRLFFIIEHWLIFSQDIFRWIHFIRFPGISAKGAMLGAIFMGFISLRSKKIHSGIYFDIFVLPLLYVVFFSEVGCFVNGCVFGLSLFGQPAILYFLVTTLAFIYLFKKLKKESIYNFFLARKTSREVDVKSLWGIYFLFFLVTFLAVNSVLENLLSNPVYLNGLNVKLGYNILLILIFLAVSIKRIGFKSLKETLKNNKNKS